MEETKVNLSAKFKPINYLDHGETYEISEAGEVRKISTNKIVKTFVNNGYMVAKLNKKDVTIHRLVALTYVQNTDPENKTTVNHIDENKLNNHYTNLEWVSQQENCQKHSQTISHSRKVIQKDLQGNIIKVYDNMIDAGKAVGLGRDSISKACMRMNNSAGGFIWDYEDEKHNIERDNKVVSVDLSQAKSLKEIFDMYDTYYVFTDGRIYNTKSKIFLKDCVNAKGAHYVSLPPKDSSKQGKNEYVHRLVALCFLPNPNGKLRVKHIDADKGNNNVENLQWY
jgi:hypothetical protein